jgi:AraC-like DNA-binding protein
MRDVAPRAIVVRPSSPALSPFVSSLGYLEGSFAHTRERALPSGTMQLLINLHRDEFCSYDADGRTTQRTGGAVLQGPYSQPTLIDPADQRAVVWVGFRFGGARPFFRAPAAAFGEQLVDLSALWGGEGAVLRERMLAARTPLESLRVLESVLLGQGLRPLELDPAGVVATRALHRGSTVSEAADRLGWTQKRLGRLFGEQVGLAPKRFARVRRFQRLLRRAAATSDTDWARLAAECGYHDQSHLIHEFRDLAGMTPTEYAPRSPAEHNHVPLLP